MNISIKEPLYVRASGTEHVLRASTIGVEKNGIYYFYDTTRTVAIGFSKDFCIENPNLFHISRTMEDREISSLQALRLVREYAQYMPPAQFEELTEKLASL